MYTHRNIGFLNHQILLSALKILYQSGSNSDSAESYDIKMAAMNLSTKGDHFTSAQNLNKDGGYVVVGFMCSLIACEQERSGNQGDQELSRSPGQ